MPVIAPFPERSGMLSSLGRESVVRIASANCRKRSTVASALEIKIPRFWPIFSAGKGTPMIPVEDGNTSAALTLSGLAIAAQTARQARTPAGPVAQFAFPEFTITARSRPPALLKAARPTIRGAATMRLGVNRAAALVPGSARIKPRSGLPLAFMPALAAENLKPCGRKIGRSEIILAASPANSRVPATRRTEAAQLLDGVRRGHGPLPQAAPVSCAPPQSIAAHAQALCLPRGRGWQERCRVSRNRRSRCRNEYQSAAAPRASNPRAPNGGRARDKPPFPPAHAQCEKARLFAPGRWPRQRRSANRFVQRAAFARGQ